MEEERKYYVARYFDDHYAETIANGLTKKEAEKLADELNEKANHKPFTEYLVRS